MEEIETSIDNFYKWLTGKEVEGYEGTYTSPRKKVPARETTACNYAYSQIRGFFSHNGIQFSKGFRGPNPSDLVPRAIAVDR